ncbi:hypothetical protein PC116_g29771, partial [Phytophthora cactorum]
MVSKRKKSTVVLQHDDRLDKDAQQDQSGATPRRSNRIGKKQTDVPEPDDKPTDGQSPPLASTRSKKKAMPKPDVIGDVIGAIDELREMEDAFRDDTKRQKLAIDKSSIPKDIEKGPADSAFYPRPDKDALESIPAELELEGRRKDKQRRKGNIAAKDENKAASEGDEIYEDGEPGDRVEGGDTPGEEVD